VLGGREEGLLHDVVHVVVVHVVVAAEQPVRHARHVPRVLPVELRQCALVARGGALGQHRVAGLREAYGKAHAR
jgi:hypothetical protein